MIPPPCISAASERVNWSRVPMLSKMISKRQCKYTGEEPGSLALNGWSSME